MTIFLTSRLKTHIKDEEGNRIAVPLDDENQILTNIKKHLKGTKRLVYVANNPDNIEENDFRILTYFESFNLTWRGGEFEEKILLDSRNISKSKEILENADLIILSGGKCLCQKKFFENIGLKDILTKFQGVVIGISAGTMNLCKTVANFPEELSDLDEPRWFEGLGFCDDIIIPHFDGENKIYQIECEEVDVIGDYVLPASYEKALTGIPNGSYILLDENDKKEYFGTVYKISKGKVKKLKRT